ncbi:hypothetical protein AKJ48_02035 [candidate division MSBL1 archaeon SCGC-AAA261O19]|uniref:Probable porphobilinogen deaminase n=2 Tax=candidate division MSBL1 TaxID=215777 RepID=A0A133VDS0_9EURY|nr:hypothetical protein AKJ48_02035 [candidate division MSBL1 archaeon SCGC-AAA261O19]
MKLRIGTRGSNLALIQTWSVGDQIKTIKPEVEIELIIVKTSGDLRRKIKGSGIFAKEVNQAVLDGDADIGVHSLKDLPTKLPEGLSLVSIPERLTPNDVLITPNGARLSDLPSDSIIGTGSPRRRAEISHLRTDLKFKKIRGNVDTRIKKVESGDFDGLITSMAALERLGLEEKASQKFDFEEVVPAAGQGSLGVVGRKDDEKTSFLGEISDEKARLESICERAFLRELGLGCKAGAGVLARAKDNEIKTLAVLHDSEGRHLVKLRGSDPVELGEKAAREVRE